MNRQNEAAHKNCAQSALTLQLVAYSIVCVYNNVKPKE